MLQHNNIDTQMLHPLRHAQARQSDRKILSQLDWLLPSNRFEALVGVRQGQYSIRINDKWRICFEWQEGELHPFNIEIVDYH